MSWRDQLRPGSFRGAAFKVQSSDGEGGRRGELHSFPDRDEPWFEDLGRGPRRWSIEAIVIGADYMREREALIDACEARGSGTLVHPWRGTLTAVCTNFRYRESTADGGMAVFTLDFAEAGAAIAAQPRTDTPSLVAGVADAVADAAPERFAAGFSVTDVPAFVEQAGAGLARKFTALAGEAGTLLGGAGPALRTFEAGLAKLPSSAVALVRQPLELAQTIRAVVGAIGRLGPNALARASALRRLLGAPQRFAPVLGATPARARERANQEALSTLIVQFGAAEAVRQIGAARLPSYNEAVQIRDGFADELDRAAIAAADAGDDDAAAALDLLRRAMVRDVTARGGSLARLYGYTPPTTEPALVIAHRLHGRPELVIARADELVTRNRVAHPGFVPGGERLEVRADD